MKPRAENIVWNNASVSADDRHRLFHQQGCVLWFTGLSGSGKSTIARALEYHLIQAGQAAYVLDGDNIRHGLNADLDFSPAARSENIRRVAEAAALFADAGLITITAFISPYMADRQRAHDIISISPDEHAAHRASRPFFEIYINTPLDICEARDPKALYAKARAGEIREFTGISAPFEAPTRPDLEVRTAGTTVDACVQDILAHMKRNGIIGEMTST